tara:strand:+ start:20358 stop:21887 length:1530 start_codon:yes stop_codon:yes gene_type:complete
MIEKNKTLIVHPFLFAIFPSFFLYAHNMGHVYFNQILMPIGVILFFTFLTLILLKLIIKDVRKVGLLVSISLILFFSYGHIYELIKIWQLSNFSNSSFHIHRYILLVFFTIFSSASYFILKTKKDLARLTNAFNTAGSVLIFTSIINIAIFFTTENFIDNDVSSSEITTKNGLDRNLLPDIYYIVPDALTSSENLIEFFDYNNEDFANELTSKGFYIASNSKSNYMRTPLSLSSALNMQYLPDDYKKNNLNIANNKVIELLKLYGYKYIHFNSGWSHTERNIFADIEINCGKVDEFILILVPTTILRIIDEKFNFLRSEIRDRVLCTFLKLSEIHKIKGPKFIFSHIQSPHPPFVFGENGEQASNTSLSLITWDPPQGYLNQVKFIEKKLLNLTDSIIAKSKVPPIIIIQGDHGSAATFSDKQDPLGIVPTNQNIKEIMGIFNALYLPGNNKNYLYKSISPVNNFRLIFNSYFNENFSLLPDSSYYTWPGKNQFVNVTEIVNEKLGDLK